MGIRRAALFITFFLSALSSVFFEMVPPPSPYDFPIEIISTQRVLRGERPFADFQAFYGPIGHYFLAGLEWPLRILEPAVAANLIYLFFTLFFLAIVICLAKRVPEDRPVLFYGVLLLILWSTIVISTLSYYSMLALLPAVLITVYSRDALAETDVSGGLRSSQVVVGLLIAFLLFLRFNFGAYAGIAVAITGVLAFLTGRRVVALASVRCLSIALAASIAILAVLAATGIARPEFTDLLLYVPRVSASRALPLGLNPKLLTLVLASTVAGLWRIPRRLLRREIDGRLVGALMLCAFISYFLMRADDEHAYPMMTISLVLVSEVDARSAERLSATKGSPRMGALEFQCLSLYFLFALLNLGGRGHYSYHAARAYWRNFHHASPLIRNGVLLSPSEVELLRYLDSHRKHGEELYIASEQGSCQSTYDLCTNLSLYLAEGVLPHQRFWCFDTASTAYANVQDEIVQGLEASKVRWIILEGLIKRNGGVISHFEAPIVTQYIRARYKPVYTVESVQQGLHYTLYERP